jgi:16S rRNA (cytosine1402-N4)-methyltransferase
MNENYHIPAMLAETIEGLNISSGGFYVDATYGGGGHSAKILEQLTDGKLIAFDQDADAAANRASHPNLIFVNHNFRYLKNFLKYYGINSVDGILADLGVSSHHFDMPERGFSFRFDAPLDMRMNQSAPVSAYNIINEYNETALYAMFKEYGELDNAKRISFAIVAARQTAPIKTTGQLCQVVEPLVPAKAASKYLAKVFQAIRIEVNQEIQVLKDFLVDAADVLKPQGRLVVLSYHSLEDRLVKNFIIKGNFEGEVQKDFFGNVTTILRPVGKKMLVPTEDEVNRNPRARSAKLRIAEKI